MTWLLSGFGDEIDADPAVQVAVLQALGARHIDVRSAWHTNIVSLDDDQLERLRAILSERDMAVSTIASPIGKVDITGDGDAELVRLARAVHAATVLAAPYIRVFSFYRGEGVPVHAIRDEVLRRLRAFADVAERAGLVLVLENEKDVYGDVPSRVLDILESVGSPALRLAWDTANFVQVGVRPYTDGYLALRPYLAHLQVKDAVAATGQVVPAGQGDGQLVETLTALRDDGFAGVVSLEPHLADQDAFGGFSGPAEFGRAARALLAMTASIGVPTA